MPDSGFTLIEAVVALFVAGVIFAALAGSAISAVQASLLGRQNQQAVDFMTRALENARSMDFGALGHDSTGIASDDRLSSCSGGKCLDPDGPGPLTSEKLYVTAGAGVFPHITTPTVNEANNTTYTVATYVTEVPGSRVEDVRRVTVFVTWTQGSQTRERSTSSLVAYTQRGLPLPVFKLVAEPTELSVNPGGTVVYRLSVTNQGAPDRWTIDLAGAGAALPWSLVRDVNGDGVYDPTVDVTPLTDTTGDGKVDTGRIQPSSTVTFFAVWETTSSTPTGTTDTDLTATSFGQPTAAGGSVTATLSTTVTTGTVTAPPSGPVMPGADDCTWSGGTVAVGTPPTFTARAYTLHQDPTGLDSNALTQLQMSAGPANETGLGRWSLNVDGTILGRGVRATSATLTDGQVLALSDGRDFADWQVQFGSGGASVGGTGVLDVWTASVPAGLNVDLRAIVYGYVNQGNTYSKQVLGGADLSVAAGTCAGLQQVRVAVPLTSVTLKNNDFLGVRLVNRSAGPVRVAYDVPSAYSSALEVAVK